MENPQIVHQVVALGVEKASVMAEKAAVEQELTLVGWDGADDPSNPQNWSQARKWFLTILTSLGGLVTLMSSSVLAPALSAMSDDLNASKEEVSMALSIYVLANAFGPIVLAPCSEVFGRKPIWIAGGSWYILWNIVCGFANNKNLLVFGRLMSGLGASAEYAVSGPISNDCWSSDDRGKAMAIQNFLPLLGPALGPILGGVTVQEANWRWLFWVLSIVDAVIVLLFILFLPETHAQTILRRKARSLSKETGRPYQTEGELTSPTLAHRLKLGLLRPCRLILHHPAIQIMSVFMAYTYGVLYIFLASFALIWTDQYGQSSAISGLHYVSFATGCMLGQQVGGWATDRVWAKLKRKRQGQAFPEYRIPMMWPGVALLPIGLFWYGWSAEKTLPWIVTDIGACLFGCAYMLSTSAAQAYVIEAFLDYTASAAAASQFLRNIFAFVFPIFAPGVYAGLGYGQGNTVLAVISIVFEIPAPYVLWRYGERLRAKGKPIE